MDIKNFIFIPLFIGAVLMFLFNIRRIVDYVRTGKPENRYDKIGERIKNVLVIAIAQKKLFRDGFAGILHALIFWGFLLFLSSVAELVFQGFYSGFNYRFLGPLLTVFTLIQDFFGILVILAVLFSFYRRYIVKVKRLVVDKEGQWDAALILSLILMVVISMFGQNIAHSAQPGKLLAYEYRPISEALAGVFFPASCGCSVFWYEVFWWSHAAFVFGFLNYLPFSKHLHVITSIPNVYFANTADKRNIVQPINFEDESLDTIGADDVDKLSWKALLDGFSCTECGRCTSVCPANTTGKTLSPRKIITDIRDRVLEKSPLILKGITEGDLTGKTLVHNHTSDLEIWECTTCNACVEECPVMIEHVPSILEMRRHLVMTESEFPPELAATFRNMEVSGSPWASDPTERGKWAEDLDVKTMSEDANAEYLFWVGCAGSYDPRSIQVSRAIVQLMQKAGISFRILGAEEKCNGDTARRLGNEYLAQELMKSNIEVLNNYAVKKIFTACPHCFNSLKNEFPQFGGNFEVFHHSELLTNLINEGKLRVKESKNLAQTITYHDSCYLGRYNQIYDQPRTVLAAGASAPVSEMERNGSKGFCCGAGGGRMFLEDVEGGRINEERTKEALSLHPDIISTACPFCMTMMTDGVKAFDKSDSVAVKDIAEILIDNIH